MPNLPKKRDAKRLLRGGPGLSVVLRTFNKIRKRVMPQPEPKTYRCPYCDFGSGYRGMDSCGKCAGTGSIFRVGDRHFPNTKDGYEKACALMKEVNKF